MRTITRNELQERLGEGGLVPLDALPLECFEAEHLPGARKLPLDDLESLATEDA